MMREEGITINPFQRRHLWVREKYEELQEWRMRIKRDDKFGRPKIQRVPSYIGSRLEFEKFYMPKLISIGPIYFNKPYVELGERYKLMWTAMYLEDTNQTVEDLYQKLLDHIAELKQLFSPYSCPNIGVDLFNDVMPWMLLVDGCTVLQVLDKTNHEVPEKVLQVSLDQLARVRQDLLLLENQIPYKVLKLLCNEQARLNRCMQNFLQIHRVVGSKEENSNEIRIAQREFSKELKVIVEEDQDKDQEDPTHLLDFLRRNLLMSSDRVQIPRDVKINQKSMHLKKYRIGTIRELKAAGIRVRKHPDNTSFHPNFVSGQLQLPELTVDGSTPLIFLNLIAYEMCPDFCNHFEISSYVVFLSSLIDHPEDVMELRSVGILHNELASDKEVADLFNKMDTVLVPETQRFAHIRDQIEAHFESNRGKIKILGWIREAYNTYFRSPWSIIALLGTWLVLLFTSIDAECSLFGSFFLIKCKVLGNLSTTCDSHGKAVKRQGQQMLSIDIVLLKAVKSCLGLDLEFDGDISSYMAT